MTRNAGLVRVAVGFAVVGSVLIAMAPSASATLSPNPIYIVPNTGSDCSGPPSNTATVRDQASSGALVSTVDATRGEMLSVVNNCPVPLVARVEDENGDLLALPTFASSATTQLDVTGAASVVFYRENPANVFNSVTDGVFIIRSTTSSAGQSPTPVLQQFGHVGDASCEALASTDLNWAGVNAGSWGISWAQWMNDGLGGPVCTRTLVYSNSQGRWVLSE